MATKKSSKKKGAMKGCSIKNGCKSKKLGYTHTKPKKKKKK